MTSKQILDNIKAKIKEMDKEYEAFPEIQIALWRLQVYIKKWEKQK